MCYKKTALARLGTWMQGHTTTIQKIQWIIVSAYAVLIIIPVFLPLPNDTARIMNNFTVFAQFLFWGIWWPFVILSVAIMGRMWCGIFCPEGTLTEFSSRYGLGKSIPRWIRWRGWPFVAFSTTTIYGQMISVYQYPKSTLILLGGSTIFAILIGLLYGREKRVWCRYLCPVNGVFDILSRLSPTFYKVDHDAWRISYTQKKNSYQIIPVNCAPLVPLRTMEGNGNCHMCGRCAGHRDAIFLTLRFPSYKIVHFSEKNTNSWETILIIYGLMGIAIGGFHWSISPWFISTKQSIAAWLIQKELIWPLTSDVPWFIFTHYPQQNDVFNFLDGFLIIIYMLSTAVLYGTALMLALAVGIFALGKWQIVRLHHFAQALIPVAGCGLFLGLTTTTFSILRTEGFFLGWVPSLRISLLVFSNLWSLWLGWSVSGCYSKSTILRFNSMFGIIFALIIFDSAWWLMFWCW